MYLFIYDESSFCLVVIDLFQAIIIFLSLIHLGSTLLHINSDYCPHRKERKNKQDRQQDTNTLKNNNKLNKI